MSAYTSKISVVPKGSAGDFFLATSQGATPIYLDAEDFPVVQIAADALALDIERVTGTKPNVSTGTPANAERAVLVGTLGKSCLIDDLIAAKKLDVSGLAGAWESFVVATVQNPVPGVKQGLVIVGSDRRGTAFGTFSLSEAIGVSPWHWWADVTPRRKSALWVRGGVFRQGSPAVKYRGIFLNDEDWGLQPWAAQTFEPETGDIGPKTYAKVFELLLRLKANFCWSAMHPSTKAFNFYPQNKVVADQYAIVMGSSHCEPMLRNNVDEWDTQKHGEWNYLTNRENVLRYWEDRVQENGRFENVYTIGMRGIHDSGMPGPETTDEKIGALEQVFAHQRAMLARHVHPDVTRVPQIFSAFKEALNLYQQGLQVPDDVILHWPNDSHGYIRQLSTPDEQKRAGGSGVYYHVSYWGAPYDYQWLCSTPPALIWEEMSKAYDYGARSLWVLNVGDLKPAEIATDFFLRLAWNPAEFGPNAASDFLHSWAARGFGEEHAQSIAEILDEYYHLGFARKPEHMGWHNAGQRSPNPKLTGARTACSPIHYGDEAARRLEQYAALAQKAEAVWAQLPADLQDAFYQLVLYPVRGANWMNQKWLHTDRSFLHAAQKRASANDYADQARQAYDQIQAETEIYNTRIAGGKWNGIMSAAPRALNVFQMPETAHFAPPAEAGLGVAVEGHIEVLSDTSPAPELEELAARWAAPSEITPDTLPIFNAYTKEKHFFDVFNTGTTPFGWTAQTDAPWIRLSEEKGCLEKETRVWVEIDWANAPVGEAIRGSITIRGAGAERVVKLRVFNPALQIPADEFVEANGVVSMEADHFTRRADKNGAGWRAIVGLGRTGNSVAVFPTTTPSLENLEDLAAQAPVLEYDFHTFQGGETEILVYALPTFRIHPGRGLRFAVAVDEAAPIVVDLEKAGEWAEGALSATRIGRASVEIGGAGKHTLQIWMIDPGVVLDKIVVDLGGLQPSYLGPPETRVAR